MRAVDNFCRNHPRFGIPRLMVVIVAGNVLVWLLSMMDTTGLIAGYLSFSPAHILRGQIWRLFTFVFISGYTSINGIIWFAIMMYFYYFIGSTLEAQWGQAKFNIYYLSGVALSVIYGFIVWGITGKYGLSAAYINFSMFFAFATMWPDMQFLLFFIIPIKAKWIAIVDAAYFAYAIITQPFPLNLLPLVAVLNYFFFCGSWLWGYIRPERVSRAARQTSRTVKFKSAVKKMQREQRNNPYTRRCEVCGRTDTAYPNLEFRYCSRCAGYHCFCEEHINNHSHFTE